MIRSSKSKKDRQQHGQKERTDNTMAKKKKGQTMIYKKIHRKLKIEQHELQ